MSDPRNSVTARRSAAVNMRNSYYNSNAPCFSGDSKMSMANGMNIDVSKVQVGHRVRSVDGSVKIVKFIVKTMIRNGKTNLVRLGSNLRITPYHPVRLKGKWCFPNDLGEVKCEDCDAVYSFVVEREEDQQQQEEKSMSICVGGLECASLGHGDTNSNTAHGHSYFGNRMLVIRDILKIQKNQRSNEGVISLQEGSCLHRDVGTGLVIGLCCT